MSSMPVLVDVDGVLADFIGHVDATIGPVDWHSWELAACVAPPLLAHLHEVIETRPGWCASMPELPGACATLREFVTAGASFVFVTSPWRGCPTWTHEREEWLAARFPEVPVIHTQHKHYVRGILLDDNQRHIARHPWPAFLIDAPYNVGGHSLRHALYKALGWRPANGIRS